MRIINTNLYFSICSRFCIDISFRLSSKVCFDFGLSYSKKSMYFWFMLYLGFFHFDIDVYKLNLNNPVKQAEQ
jgi:hypothetical protein